jgi:predicted Zn-dependent peptidase
LLVGNLESLNGEIEELFGRFEQRPEPDPFEPAPAPAPRVRAEARDSNQSHLRLSYRSAFESSDPHQRAALQIYSTVLGGSMSSRLFDEIREQRGLAYSVHSFAHVYADAPVVQISAGLDSSNCLEALKRMKEIVAELHDQGPTSEEVERARSYAAGARAIAFENTGAVARYAAQQVIVYREDPDPDRVISLLDEVTYDDAARAAASIDLDPSVACVGTQTVEELSSA